MKKKGIGELEMAILQTFKGEGEMTVKEVSELLGNKNSYNTIMTVMHRLTLKKVLVRKKIGLKYHYRIKETISSFLKKKLLGIRPAQMICYLFENPETITEEELSQMEQMLEKAKQERKKCL